jgi:hypothetical protein
LKHRLLILNALLLALIGLAGWKIRENWRMEQAREQAFWQQGLPKVDAPPLGLPAAGKATLAAGYVEIADKLLLSRDRNPAIAIEVVAPKPIPALPKYYGVMNLGGGPSIILAPAGGKQRAYKLGDQIGELTLKDITRTTIDFQWEDKILTAKLSDLLDTQAAAPPPEAPKAEAAKANANAQTTRLAGPVDAKPGTDVGGGIRACVPGDNSPAGTIKDGFKKMISATPFGDQCRWEQAK